MRAGLSSARAARRLPARLRSRQTSRGARGAAVDPRPLLLSRRHARHEFRAPAGDHQRHHRTPAGAGRRSRIPARCTSNRRPRRNICRRSPRENPQSAAAAADDAAHLDRQHAGGADAFRPVEQHRLRGRRPAALHAVSARAAAESVRRTDRVQHLRPAHQHGVAQESGPRAFSALRRCAGGLAGRRAGTGRRALHPLRLVASRRGAGAFQRAGKLLVERGAPGRLAFRLHAARHPGAARPATRATRGVAHAVRALRIHVRG